MTLNVKAKKQGDLKHLHSIVHVDLTRSILTSSTVKGGISSLHFPTFSFIEIPNRYKLSQTKVIPLY